MSLSAGTLRKLENLAFAPKTVRRGVLRGDRRSTRRGSSLEFADYRAYTPGDDLRRLDWNVYARSDKPFLKLFEEEEDLGVHILLDTSESMNWGAGTENKFEYAKAAAAGLALIALAGGDRCSITAFSDTSPGARFGPVRNLISFAGVLPFLETRVPQGTTQIDRVLRRFTQQVKSPGITAVISDLFSPGGFQDGLKHLDQKGHEILLVHVLSPEELTPQIAGDLKLVDSETGATQEITITGGLRRQYQTRVLAWRTEIHDFCRARRIHYFPISTGESPERFLLFELRRRGLIR